VPDQAELRQLFHTLNNQLGIILSHAELIEAKAQDERQKARASQVVAAAVEGANHRPPSPPGRGRSLGRTTLVIRHVAGMTSAWRLVSRRW